MMNRLFLATAVVSLSLAGVGCSSMNTADSSWNSNTPSNGTNANSQSVPNHGMPDYATDSSRRSNDSQNSTARSGSDQGSLGNPDGSNQPGVNNSTGPLNNNSNMSGTASEGQ